MRSIKKIYIKNLNEFVKIVNKINKKHHDQLWFRGCDDSRYKLTPSLYRDGMSVTAKHIRQIIAEEKRMISTFYYRSMPFRHHAIEKYGWDILFYMQHYGIPTRLLDWTENPFIALFFAIGGKYNIAKSSADVSVWVLNPVIWNQNIHICNNSRVFEPDDKNISRYNPPLIRQRRTRFPVAMYGAHNNPRIVAQRGVFMTFGCRVKSMEYMYKNNLVHGNRYLYKIIIPKDCVGNLRDSLKYTGFAESMIFPDLDNLAIEIKRDFGF